MKQSKRLTRDEKAAVSAYYLNPKDWMKQSESEFYITIVNKKTGQTRRIDKYARRKGER